MITLGYYYSANTTTIAALTMTNKDDHHYCYFCYYCYYYKLLFQSVLFCLSTFHENNLSCI